MDALHPLIQIEGVASTSEQKAVEECTLRDDNVFVHGLMLRVEPYVSPLNLVGVGHETCARKTPE
eukprot:5712912-Alexandrium_andersonii.AAC.1